MCLYSVRGVQLSRYLRLSRYLFNIEIKIIGFNLEILVIFVYTIVHYAEDITVMILLVVLSYSKLLLLCSYCTYM